ncbi:hypothetical protein Y1Q_0023958 [Alligator mississippiensis]|uniref:Uncharacterized protein n=1 Tax=Alligator mississippiensis TaxID=8496 RepID=A0A151MLT8_ALLMI|nr:hypothetical protein Y1Q_0023958 [Alligator mississippiensis]
MVRKKHSFPVHSTSYRHSQLLQPLPVSRNTNSACNTASDRDFLWLVLAPQDSLRLCRHQVLSQRLQGFLIPKPDEIFEWNKRTSQKS